MFHINAFNSFAILIFKNAVQELLDQHIIILDFVSGKASISYLEPERFQVIGLEFVQDI